MDNFEELLNRVRTMLMYGCTKADVHGRLKSEGLAEEIIYLTFIAAEIVIESDKSPSEDVTVDEIPVTTCIK